MSLDTCDFSYTMYTTVDDLNDWLLEVYIEPCSSIYSKNIYYINRSGIITELPPRSNSLACLGTPPIIPCPYEEPGYITYGGKEYYGDVRWVDGWFTDLVEGRLFDKLSHEDASKLAGHIRAAMVEVLL